MEPKFIREPLFVENGIPVFSLKDDYIENYEKISNDHLDYLETHGENPFMAEDYWNQLEDDTIEILKPHLRDGLKILDIGVGLGRLLSKLDFDLDKYGVDISESYLNEAKKKGIKVILSKIEELPYEDDFFDIIVSTDVLEHVFNLYECISQIKRVLKPQGVLLVRVPNKEDLQVYIDYDQYKYVHIRSFDKASLVILFNKVFGFKSLEIQELGFIRSDARLKKVTKLNLDNLDFIERLVYHFRQGSFDKQGIAEFVSKSFDEYHQFNFRFRNRFFLRQFFKSIYWLFNKFHSNQLELDRYYNKLEVAALFKNDS